MERRLDKMKAEDTVIDIGEDKYDGLGADTLVQIQAEETWKARDGEIEAAKVRGLEAGLEQGKAEGKRELIEWGDEFCPHSKGGIPGGITLKRQCCQCWQALKEVLGE